MNLMARKCGVDLCKCHKIPNLISAEKQPFQNEKAAFSYTYTNFDVLKLFNPQNALDMPCIILAPKKKGAMPMQEAELKAAAVGILTYLAITNEETTRHSGEDGEIMEFDATYDLVMFKLAMRYLARMDMEETEVRLSGH